MNTDLLPNFCNIVHFFSSMHIRRAIELENDCILHQAIFGHTKQSKGLLIHVLLTNNAMER